VKDIVRIGHSMPSATHVPFKLDPGWERCDKSSCARCHGKGCTRSVHVRIFGNTFSKALHIVTVHSKHTRALIFQNFCQNTTRRSCGQLPVEGVAVS
jgi:DnaJ-class molecular chaperone